MILKTSVKPNLRWLLATLISILITITAYYVIGSRLLDKNDWSPFGDIFGGLNTLFSGLAFGAIIYTILVQQQELRLQRQEFEYQRREFKMNRMTNMIYRQIGLCIDRLNGFQIRNSTQDDLVGRNAITWVLHKLTPVPYVRIKASQIDIEKKFLTEIYDLIIQNKAEIVRLTDTVHNSCLVLQFMFKNKDEVSIISREDLDELKTLFFANLGLEIDNFFVKMEIVLSQRTKEKEKTELLKQIRLINRYQTYSYRYIQGVTSQKTEESSATNSKHYKLS